MLTVPLAVLISFGDHHSEIKTCPQSSLARKDQVKSTLRDAISRIWPCPKKQQDFIGINIEWALIITKLEIAGNDWMSKHPS